MTPAPGSWPTTSSSCSPRWPRTSRTRSALKARRAVVERDLEAGRQRQAALEQLAAEATPRLNAARENWYPLSTGRERLRSLGSLAEERRRLLGAADAVPDTGRDPDQLEQQAARVRDEQAGLERQILDRTRGPGRRDGRQTGRRTGRRRRGQAARGRCSAPPRTGAKAWPSSPGRSARRGPGWSPPRPSSAASANPRRPARSAAGRRTASSPRWNRRWQASRTARNPSTPTTRTPARPWTPSSPKSTRSKAAEREGERERGALVARRDALQLGLNRKDGSGHVLGAAGTCAGVVWDPWRR